MSTSLLQPGLLFAERYRIERFLAQGGFGAVYVAEQLATELRVALKVLWPHVLASADAVEKFKQEARIAGRVDSDHIVRVFDAGFDAATTMPFLVMELLRGQDLQKVVERSGPLAPELVASYLRQTATALDKAHGFRDREGRPTPIIHRDLKPENLFLTHREDGTPHVKVLDFGIAKVLSDATKASQQVKGTPLYMASEQAAGMPISPVTDVWALGLIAFFLLTGKSYWRAGSTEGAGLAQLFGEVLSLPIVPASQRAAEIGCAVPCASGFDAWFVRCVNRDPSARFSSAGEAASQLFSVLGQPIAAPPTVASRVGAQQAPSARVAASTPVVPASTPVATSTPPPATAPAPGSPPSSAPLGVGTMAALGASQPVPVSRSPWGFVGGAIVVVTMAAGAGFWARGSGGSHVAPAAPPAAPTVSPAPAGAPTPSAAPQVVAGTALPAEPTVTAAAPAASSASRPTAPPSWGGTPKPQGPTPKAEPPPPPAKAPATAPPGKNSKEVWNER